MSQVTNYIQKELDKGFSKKQITQKLLQAGYSQQEITESFQSIESKQPLLTRKLPDTLHTDHHVKWSKIIFPILGIAVLAFFVILVWQYSSVFVPSPSPCEQVTSQEEKDRCILELAALGKRDCTGLQSTIFIAACEQKLWETDKCTYTLLLGGDVNACLLQQAIETKDTTYCTRMEEHSDCLYQLATAAEDYTLCAGDGQCLFKYAQEQQDVSACAEIKTMFQWQCYDAYAATTGDTSVCSNGSFICGYPSSGTEEEKKAFIDERIDALSTSIEAGEDLSERDEIMYVYAEEFKDVIFCDYIVDESLQEECYMMRE